jgi:hypothetical protein
MLAYEVSVCLTCSSYIGVLTSSAFLAEIGDVVDERAYACVVDDEIDAATVGKLLDFGRLVVGLVVQTLDFGADLLLDGFDLVV